MHLEWIIYSLLLVGAIVYAASRSLRRNHAILTTAGAAALVLFASSRWHSALEKRAENQANLRQALPREGRPGGYVSSDTCQACHPNQYASWHKSFHRTMTQFADPKSVAGKFDHADLTLDGERYHLEQRGDEFWVEMADPDHPASPLKTAAPSASPNSAPRVQKRVGMLTGSHHMQVYWVPGKDGNLQYAFPFAYLIRDQRWVPRRDIFLRDPAIPHPVQIWNLNCINCHVTAGQPGMDVPSRTLHSRTAEFGISCEACHGPAENHVALNRNPARRYALHLSGKPDGSIVNPIKLAPKSSSQVCGRCHGVNWIPDREDWRKNGFQFQPGEDLQSKYPVVQPTSLETQPWFHAPLKKNPTLFDGQFWADGRVRVSGREYNGLIESPCYKRGELTCFSCHSMHESNPAGQLGAGMESNQACLQCHKEYSKNLQAHTHHDPKSSGSLCYNCHMPHTTYGLLKAIRSHTIDVPSVKASQETGRPNACNLCHLDQTLSWTGQYLSQWYRQPAPTLTEDESNIAASLLWLLRGDAGQRALIAWSMGWEPAKRASGDAWLAPFLGHAFEDPYAAVRYIAGHSLQRLPGFGEFPFDFVGPKEHRERAHQHALELWNQNRVKRSIQPREQLLLGPEGKLETSTFTRLARERSNRSLELQE